MKKLIGVEWCGCCEEEIEFEILYSLESDIKMPICTCGELLVICSECAMVGCCTCKDGSNFKLKQD